MPKRDYGCDNNFLFASEFVQYAIIYCMFSWLNNKCKLCPSWDNDLGIISNMEDVELYCVSLLQITLFNYTRLYDRDRSRGRAERGGGGAVCHRARDPPPPRWAFDSSTNNDRLEVILRAPQSDGHPTIDFVTIVLKNWTEKFMTRLPVIVDLPN